MANITKRDHVIEVAHATGFSQAQIRNIVEEFLNYSKDCLANGDTIELRKFGTFYSKLRKSRSARNPKTGETVILEQSIAPLFKFSTELKSRISESLAIPIAEMAANNDEILSTSPSKL